MDQSADITTLKHRVEEILGISPLEQQWFSKIDSMLPDTTLLKDLLSTPGDCWVESDGDERPRTIALKLLRVAKACASCRQAECPHLTAATESHAACLRYFIAQENADVNEAAIQVAQQGHAPGLQLLLEHRAATDHAIEDGITAAMVAALE